MKRFSDRISKTNLNESNEPQKANSVFNPGNALLKTGIMNHYTPIQNILTNIRNLYCCHLGIAAELGEDNVSIKLSSSRFTSPQKVNELLYTNLYYDTNYQQSCLSSYQHIYLQAYRYDLAFAADNSQHDFNKHRRFDDGADLAQSFR